MCTVWVRYTSSSEVWLVCSPAKLQILKVYTMCTCKGIKWQIKAFACICIHIWACWLLCLIERSSPSTWGHWTAVRVASRRLCTCGSVSWISNFCYHYWDSLQVPTDNRLTLKGVSVTRESTDILLLLENEVLFNKSDKKKKKKNLGAIICVTSGAAIPTNTQTEYCIPRLHMCTKAMKV